MENRSGNGSLDKQRFAASTLRSSKMCGEDAGERCRSSNASGSISVRTTTAERIDSFRDLRVYQLAFELQQEVFELSKTFPLEERYALTDQIRRATRSIGANLSEAWQKRRYAAHFISKLSDSDGEQAEAQHWLETARECGYVPNNVSQKLLTKCRRIGQMLGTMMRQPEKFCPTNSA